MVAGPNGSGKTTLVNHPRVQDVEFGRFINPDDIAATLAGDYDRRVREAQSLADAERPPHPSSSAFMCSTASRNSALKSCTTWPALRTLSIRPTPWPTK